MADDRIVLQLDTGDSEARAKALGLSLNQVEVAAAGVGGTAGNSGEFGRGMLQASYAVQDFTSVLGTQGLGRAIGSVQNNIPLLLASLGAGPGLAGILSVVSIGVGMLVDNWGKLTGAWDDEETKKETERQKDLARALEATAQAAEKLAKTLPREEREDQSRFRKAVGEFGGPAVLKELQEALVAKSGSFGPEDDRKMAQNLFANLMQGNRSAFGLLDELQLRGQVGAVLGGAPTPREQRAIDQRRAAKEREELEKAREKEERAKEKADREAEAAWKRADAEEQAGRQADLRAQGRIRGRAASNAQDMARRLDRARQQQEAPPKLPAGHLPLTAPGPLTARTLDAMTSTMQQLAGNQAHDMARFQQIEALQREARRLGRQRVQPMNNAGWN
jgi:hypothetical protein